MLLLENGAKVTSWMREERGGRREHLLKERRRREGGRGRIKEARGRNKGLR
jgi:hypothetical protein